MRFNIFKIIRISTCNLIAGVFASLAVTSVLAAPADVRLLVDVSGSMKTADPQSVRGPATALLATLLPQDSLGGIWLFGSDVRPLVPHGPVDLRWNALAQPIASSIGATDRFTHIESALREGIGVPVQARAACHVILITDGIVDVQGGEEASRASRDRILKTVIPAAISNGCRLHTIALSERADLPLLRQMALQTEGLFTLLSGAGDLIPVMLDALELAIKSQQLPTVDEHIVVDADIDQMRLIRLNNTEPLALVTAEARIDQESNAPGMQWYVGEGYQAMIWDRPTPGRYGLSDGQDRHDRILIDSAVNLTITELSPTLVPDQTLGIAASVVGPKGRIDDPARVYRVDFGDTNAPVMSTGSTLQSQIDSPLPGSYVMTIQSQDQQHMRQIQRRFEVLAQTPALEIANDTTQATRAAPEPLTAEALQPTPMPSNQADSAPPNAGSGVPLIEVDRAQLNAVLPEELHSWPLWQLIGLGLVLLATLAMVIGLFSRSHHHSET